MTKSPPGLRKSHVKPASDRLDGEAHPAGIESAKVAGVKVRICNQAKTVCDALRSRDRIGVDAAFDALKTCLRQGGFPRTP